MKAFYQHTFPKEQCLVRRCLAYKLHFHHQIELVYMFEGSAKAVVDGTEYSIGAGDVLVVFPNQLHEYKVAEGEVFFITIFPPEILPEFKELFYGMIPKSNVLSTGNKNEMLKYIAERLPVIKESDNKYKEHMYRGLIAAFFGELLSELEFVKAKNGDLSVVRQILSYCNKNYLNDISLEEAAEYLHVSKFYVSHLLNDKLNISFNGYINSLRVADAVAMLDDGGVDMTEIAQKSGFNTVRTFNRAFKDIYGVSPTMYKKMKKDT